MAVDMFLKLEGIKGESGDHKHQGEIEIMSFSWGINQTGAHGAGGGGGAGKVNVHDLSFVKLLDTASPVLMEKACRGEHIGSGVLTLRKAGGQQLEYLKIKLNELLITSYQTGHAGGGEPSEQVSLSFQSLEMSASEQREDGSIGGTTTVSCTFGKH